MSEILYLSDPHGKWAVQGGRDSLPLDQYKPFRKIDVHIFGPFCLASLSLTQIK